MDHYYYRYHNKGGKKNKAWSHFDCDEQSFRDKIKPKITSNMNDIENIRDRVKYIPVRLSYSQRKKLRLLNAVLNVNDYTNKVDDPNYEGEEKSGSPPRRQEQVKNIAAILTGMLLSVDYEAGQKLLKGEGNYMEYKEIFEELVEIGRRYKIMNPEKMRTEYGKLIYLLQDMLIPQITESMEGFCCLTKVLTVHDLLEKGGALGVLDDELIRIATMEIVDNGTKSKHEIQDDIKMKEKSVDFLADKFKTDKLDDEGIKLCLRSVSDNNSFLRSNCEPIVKLIEYLKEYFSPDKEEPEFSLKIEEGQLGARLSHKHSDQYEFVLQSLTLWKNITNDMFKLWCLAEDDLLDPDNRYHLSNTGQGVQRLQPSLRVLPAMEDLLSATKQVVNSWVGSSKIHMGDHTVPNTLMFIDKYTQVPRIINPILNVMKNLPKVIEKDKGLKDYVNRKYGSLEGACKHILTDFFKYAFDGSGADNFYDAGSCIDGRLTSAWNWCSKLEEKDYYHLFKLTGFLGFDGDFQK
jgi:hypothetical protein